jgi:hypothetical protein
MSNDLDKPTEITREDIDRITNIINNHILKTINCSWCNDCSWVREVGPNYICQTCEQKERSAGRPLVFSAPVRDAYWESF